MFPVEAEDGLEKKKQDKYTADRVDGYIQLRLVAILFRFTTLYPYFSLFLLCFFQFYPLCRFENLHTARKERE